MALKQKAATGGLKRNQIKLPLGERIFNVANYAIMTIIAFICLYPMLYVAFASVSNSNQLIRHSGPLLYPLGFNLDAYKRVFDNPMIMRGYANTLFILVVGTIVSVLVTAIGAYALSRKNVLWNRALNLIVAFTMFFSGGIIPFYITLQDLHLTGTHWGLILPFAVSTYNLIIMRTSFASIPDSLFEAAHIDGAGHVRILLQMVIPLSKAVIAVMVLYYGVAYWNGWFWASTILRDRSMYPLQVILREILMVTSGANVMAAGSGMDTDAVAESIKYATIMVATVPVLCVYPFIQKYFQKGVMVGSIKE